MKPGWWSRSRGLGGDELFGVYPSFRLVPRVALATAVAGLDAGKVRLPCGACCEQEGPRRSGRAGVLASEGGFADAYGAVRQLFAPAGLRVSGVRIPVDRRRGAGNRSRSCRPRHAARGGELPGGPTPGRYGSRCRWPIRLRSACRCSTIASSTSHSPCRQARGLRATRDPNEGCGSSTDHEAAVLSSVRCVDEGAAPERSCEMRSCRRHCRSRLSSPLPCRRLPLGEIRGAKDPLEPRLVDLRLAAVAGSQRLHLVER